MASASEHRQSRKAEKYRLERKRLRRALNYRLDFRLRPVSLFHSGKTYPSRREVKRGAPLPQSGPWKQRRVSRPPKHTDLHARKVMIRRTDKRIRETVKEMRRLLKGSRLQMAHRMLGGMPVLEVSMESPAAVSEDLHKESRGYSTFMVMVNAYGKPEPTVCYQDHQVSLVEFARGVNDLNRRVEEYRRAREAE